MPANPPIDPKPISLDERLACPGSDNRGCNSKDYGLVAVGVAACECGITREDLVRCSRCQSANIKGSVVCFGTIRARRSQEHEQDLECNEEEIVEGIEEETVE